MLPLIICLDTETTGLHEPEAIQVAFKLLKFNSAANQYQNVFSDGRVFNQRLRPTKTIENEASSVHGITNNDLMEEMSVLDFSLHNAVTGEALMATALNLDELDDIIDTNDVYIIGHNIQFDIDCLRRTAQTEFDIHWLESVKLIDTLKLARNHFNFDSNRLSDIMVNAVGLSPDLVQQKSHDALTDVEFCEMFLNWCVQNWTHQNTWASDFSLSCIGNIEILSRRLSKEQYGFLKQISQYCDHWDLEGLINLFNLNYTKTNFAIDLVNAKFAEMRLPTITLNGNPNILNARLEPTFLHLAQVCEDELEHEVRKHLPFHDEKIRDKMLDVLADEDFAVNVNQLKEIGILLAKEDIVNASIKYYHLLHDVFNNLSGDLTFTIKDHIDYCHNHMKEYLDFVQ